MSIISELSDSGENYGSNVELFLRRHEQTSVHPRLGPDKRLEK